VHKFADDHFYKQFDRYEAGQQRFEAVARHAAIILNSLQEEREKRRKLLETTIEKMKEQVPGIALVLELKEQLDELNE
jgi:hypothetical protein